MSSVMVFEWTFSPLDYFEEAIEISRQDYTMTIAEGKVHAKVDSETYEADPGMRQRMHDALNDRFLGVQLLTHRPYELLRSTMIREHPDGRRDIFVEPEPARIVISAGTVDIQVGQGRKRHRGLKAREDREENEPRGVGQHLSFYRRVTPFTASKPGRRSTRS